MDSLAQSILSLLFSIFGHGQFFKTLLAPIITKGRPSLLNVNEVMKRSEEAEASHWGRKGGLPTSLISNPPPQSRNYILLKLLPFGFLRLYFDSYIYLGGAIMTQRIS